MLGLDFCLLERGDTRATFNENAEMDDRAAALTPHRCLSGSRRPRRRDHSRRAPNFVKTAHLAGDCEPVETAWQSDAEQSFNPASLRVVGLDKVRREQSARVQFPPSHYLHLVRDRRALARCGRRFNSRRLGSVPKCPANDGILRFPRRDVSSLARRREPRPLARLEDQCARRVVRTGLSDTATRNLGHNRDTPGLPQAAFALLINRGDDRNRTGVDGFAGRCVATPPRRRGT